MKEILHKSFFSLHQTATEINPSELSSIFAIKYVYFIRKTGDIFLSLWERVKKTFFDHFNDTAFNVISICFLHYFLWKDSSLTFYKSCMTNLKVMNFEKILMLCSKYFQTNRNFSTSESRKSYFLIDKNAIWVLRLKSICGKFVLKLFTNKCT